MHPAPMVWTRSCCKFSTSARVASTHGSNALLPLEPRKTRSYSRKSKLFTTYLEGRTAARESRLLCEEAGLESQGIAWQD